MVPMDHLEVVFNGEVVQTLDGLSSVSAEFSGKLKLSESGWVVLRAWNDDASPDVLDRFPFGTTNPVFIEVDGQPVRSPQDAQYFLDWIARVREATMSNNSYNTQAERQAVLSHIDAATAVFQERMTE